MQLQFFDMSVTLTPPGGHLEPLPITLGPNWQPNDIRLAFVSASATGGGQATLTMSMNPDAPTGFTAAYSRNPGKETHGVYYRRLAAGDADTGVYWTKPTGWLHFMLALVTVRGVSPTSGPTAGNQTVTYTTGDSTGMTATVPSLAVPGAGAMVMMVGNVATPEQIPWPNWAVPVGVPAGWTHLAATDKSGLNFYQYDTSPGLVVVGKSFAGSGSTGSMVFPTGNGSPAFASLYAFLPAAADVSGTAGAASETDTSASATFLSSTTSANTAGSASETDTTGTAFNALQGYWISDPLTLPGDPVSGSVVRWTATTPSVGSTVKVETSINNGASWDLAAVNQPVPRLQAGDTVTRSVLARVTLTRVLATDPPPTVSALEVQVSADSSVDELVPIGHGMIDKVTVKAVAGTAGSGSTASGVSSGAVTRTSGGQSGGGTSITVHVTDLSRAIKRNVWQQPFTVPSGLNYGQAAMSMVKNRLPSQTDFSIASTTRLTPLLVYGMDQGGDPWQDIAELAQAIGFEAFFDPRGVFVFRPVPDPRQGIPVWTFDENFNPIVAEASRELSDEQTFNDVVVAGQSSSSQNPVTAEAFDDDPSSPTYILGPYGRVTQRLTFSQIIDQGQAQDAANATLYNSLGAADTVTITVVPHPALEPGDVVKINVSNVNANGTYMINSMVTPLSPAEAQQLVCFRQSTNT